MVNNWLEDCEREDVGVLNKGDSEVTGAGCRDTPQQLMCMCAELCASSGRHPRVAPKESWCAVHWALKRRSSLEVHTSSKVSMPRPDLAPAAAGWPPLPAAAFPGITLSLGRAFFEGGPSAIGVLICNILVCPDQGPMAANELRDLPGMTTRSASLTGPWKYQRSVSLRQHHFNMMIVLWTSLLHETRSASRRSVATPCLRVTS